MLSIIIPTLNEAPALARLLPHLHATVGAGVAYEILVCDAGSTDDTAATARRHGAQVLPAPQPGRARQLNLGARHAAGSVLYFLHADTLPPPDFGRLIGHYYAQGFLSGCFRLTFDSRHWILRFSGWASRFNARNFQFGDQSLYVLKAAFEEAGGFREELLVMEDVEIVTRLKRRLPFRVMPQSVVTSARKYRQHGVAKTELTHAVLLGLYLLHVRQRTLVRVYQKLLPRKA
jgi:rSAM/selenodomain-associated transferase 2